MPSWVNQNFPAGTSIVFIYVALFNIYVVD